MFKNRWTSSGSHAWLILLLLQFSGQYFRKNSREIVWNNSHVDACVDLEINLLLSNLRSISHRYLSGDIAPRNLWYYPLFSPGQLLIYTHVCSVLLFSTWMAYHIFGMSLCFGVVRSISTFVISIQTFIFNCVSVFLRWFPFSYYSARRTRLSMLSLLILHCCCLTVSVWRGMLIVFSSVSFPSNCISPFFKAP